MPLLWLSIAFLAGILLGKIFPAGWMVWSAISAACISLVWLERRFLQSNPKWQRFRKRVLLPPGVILFFLALGALRFTLSIPIFSPNDLAYYNDRGTYVITGTVSTPPDRRQDAIYLEFKAMEIEDLLEADPSQAISKIAGTARVRLPTYLEWEYGDMLRFTAKPQTPSEDSNFSYKEFLSRQGIYTVIYYPQHVQLVEKDQGSPVIAFLEDLRQKARFVIFRQFPQPESGLLAGILLGLDNDLPESLKQAYRDTGTAHIIAISGFNMAVIAGLILFLAARVFNRYQAAAVASVFLVLYTLLVGGSPSVVRAAIMAVAAFGGHLIGRRQMGLNALGLTAAAMCLFNPGLLWDVSFQLSFSATFGLVVFGKPLQDWSKRMMEKRLSDEQVHMLSGPLNEYFLFTLAAQVMTLPVIAIQFGRISLSSLLANPLVLPAQPAVLILGGIATITGMFIPAVGKALSVVAWPMLAYTNRMVELLAKIRIGSLVIHPQLAIWMGIILVLFIVIFLFRNFFKKIFNGHFIWIMFILVLASISVWSMALHSPDGKLHLVLSRTGEESAIYFRSADGKTIVLDPGKEMNELSSTLSRDLSPWDFKVDEVWLSTRSSAGNLEILNERILVSKAVLTPPVYQAAADQKPVQIPALINQEKLSTGSTHACGGVQLTVIAEDTRSSALLITTDELHILIPNGVDFAMIRDTGFEVLENLDVLILADDDISYIPPRVWQSLHPKLVLWNSPSLSPDPEWIGTDSNSRVELVIKGSDWQIEVK